MKKKINLLKSKANIIRKSIIKMLAEAKSGHPGGSLSATEIVTCLYFVRGRKLINQAEFDSFYNDLTEIVKMIQGLRKTL